MPQKVPFSHLERIASASSPAKNESPFEFSLCLSRACLGKMIIFSIKWRKRYAFLNRTGDGRLWVPAADVCGEQLERTPWPAVVRI